MILSDKYLWTSDSLLVDNSKKLKKHQEHDQSSHGNWASSTEVESLDYIPDSESQPDLYSDDFFREENDQNIANLYRANMSKKDLEVKELNKKSLNIEYYTGTGFEEVNNYLRDNSNNVDSDLNDSMKKQKQKFI